MALGVGVVGGIYGIGGGPILGPVLVGRGPPGARVAPGAVAPDWAVGVACGLGGLVGNYVDARLQPRLPERRWRLLLGFPAMGLAALYVVQAVS